ncbi:MAG: IclR family transcriptional regulator [Acidovorax sp.]|uniref:IclR family transcriptional regulator n=1 Tax=Acidovorax sp. TaxID=1872122 RepID=UPI00391B8E26
MTLPASSAARRKNHEEPTLNRSLERGVEILRAFRPGADLLGNGELAERTGLSRATVSRLAQTLVQCGLLEHDAAHRAYRLAAPVLSFAHAMRSGSTILQIAAPMMRTAAEKLRVNVGLAVADREEMVYLESIRYNRKVSLRSVVAGQRVPIELTSLGRAYLCAVSEPQRRELMTRIGQQRLSGWKAIREEILAAVQLFARKGHCTASWQPEVVAIAIPIVTPVGSIYVLNMSVTTQQSVLEIESELSAPLKALAEKITDSVRRLD